MLKEQQFLRAATYLLELQNLPDILNKKFRDQSKFSVLELRELNQTNSLSEYAGMNAEQRELRLEESIRRLAKLAEGHNEGPTQMPKMRISRSSGFLLPQDLENITFTDPSSNLERKNFIISNYSAETHHGDTFLEEIRQIYASDSKEGNFFLLKIVALGLGFILARIQNLLALILILYLQILKWAFLPKTPD